MKSPITISRARRILGKEYESYSDEAVLDLISKARILALACIDKINKNAPSSGTNKLILEVR